MAKKAAKKRLVLVDGSSYLYRAFHAMPYFTNSHGEPTGAIYGMTNMLRKLLNDYTPEYIVVVFDAKGKTFRHNLYKEYKAHRPPMPDELREQIEAVHEVIKAMGLPILQIGGVEADDVIGTLSVMASKQGMSTLISSSDKDLTQLVHDDVIMVDSMSDTTFDIEGVKNKFGVIPEQMIDYLALVGDTSDNIPGVPKVGPKTAAKWLQTYGSLDAIVEHADDIKGKIGENLRGALQQLPLSKTLATVKCDVALDKSPEQLQRKTPDDDRLRELFLRYEFKTWLADLGGVGASANHENKVKTNYQVILDNKSLDIWLKQLKHAKLFAFDTETTGLDAMRAELVGMSFCTEAGHSAYLPLAHHYPGAPQQLDRAAVLKKFKTLLEDPKHKKVGQNLKYDINVLANYDIHLRGVAFDTMLESYVLDSTATRHDMDSLSLKYLGHKTIKYEEVAGKGKKQIGFDEVALEQAGDYAAEDADITLRLHQTLWPRVQAIPALSTLFTEIELPLLTVLARVERNGVRIDAAMLQQQSRELAQRLMQLEQQAYEAAEQPFNMASPKQIQEILFTKQGLPVIKKTPKGQPSTAEDVLQELALDYPLPSLILQHRGLSKLKSTYTDKLPQMINPDTGRVHTSYHQAVTATGRLSSSDPNLQNIPVRSEEGKRIRYAFIANPGCKILAADYSQIELRIMAHLSGDKGLCDAFAQNLDIHRATAAEVFGVELDAVTDDMRRHAKAINFGLIYGMSAFGLAKQLKIDRAAAQEYVEIYFGRYPGVKTYMEKTRAQAHEDGFVETLFGRRLYLPEINSSNHIRRQAAERTAINAPMQGTAADLIKKAMLVADDWIQTSSADVKMVMQVHDELVFEIAEADLEEAERHIRAAMTEVATLNVPLQVAVGVGDNWGEAH